MTGELMNSSSNTVHEVNCAYIVNFVHNFSFVHVGGGGATERARLISKR